MKRIDWDKRYASFIASKGYSRLDVAVGSRAGALALMNAALGKEFAEKYPQ